MSETCHHCGAQHWAQEATAKVAGQLLYGVCCRKGTIQLSPLQATPPVLDNLLQGNTPVSRAVLKQTLKYSAAFQMASTGVYTTDPSLQPYFVLGYSDFAMDVI